MGDEIMSTSTRESVGKHRNQFQLHYASTVYLRRLKK